MKRMYKYMYIFTLISLTKGSMNSSKNDEYHNVKVPLMFLKSFKNYNMDHRYFKGYVNSSKKIKKEFAKFYKENKHLDVLHLESGKLNIIIKNDSMDGYLIHPLLLTHYNEYIVI